MSDPWQEAVFLVGFLSALSAMLLLLVYLETTLDRPPGLRRPRPRARVTVAVVRMFRTLISVGQPHRPWGQNDHLGASGTTDVN